MGKDASCNKIGAEWEALRAGEEWNGNELKNICIRVL